MQILTYADFEWDPDKDIINQFKHDISFFEAQKAFLDKDRVIAEDCKHSHSEPRYYCFGKISDYVVTVRFTFRDKIVRIIGAGYWRQGRKIYERKRKELHK
jgi:uncharacterized DUF497 family protein